MAFDALSTRDVPVSDAVLAQLFTEARTRAVAGRPQISQVPFAIFALRFFIQSGLSADHLRQ